MRPSTYVDALFHAYFCQNQSTMRIKVIKAKFSVEWQDKNTNFTHNLHWMELYFSDFCCSNGSPYGYIDTWADSSYFLYVVVGSICKTFALFICMQKTTAPSNVDYYM
jgi:hypothetical protein